MSGVNKVFIVGHVGKDPESRAAGESTKCQFSVATSEKVKDQERTEWHRVVTWGKQAELCAKYVAKGSLVAVDGKIQTREYEKDGQKRYVTEIIANNVTFLGKPPAAKSRPDQDPNNGAETDEIPF